MWFKKICSCNRWETCTIRIRTKFFRIQSLVFRLPQIVSIYSVCALLSFELSCFKNKYFKYIIFYIFLSIFPLYVLFLPFSLRLSPFFLFFLFFIFSPAKIISADNPTPPTPPPSRGEWYTVYMPFRVGYITTVWHLCSSVQ